MATTARRPLDWGGIAGLAFVALVIVTVVALLNDLDSHKDRGDFASYYGDFRGSSHEWRELLANAVIILAAFCFAWFLRRLHELIRPVDASLAALAAGGGFLFLALLLAAFVASTAVGTTIAYSDDYRVDIDTAILMSNLALFLYTAAGVGSAVMVWAASLAARRGGLLPRTVVWGGFVAAVAALATVAVDGLGLVLPLLWVGTVSVVLLRPSAQASGVT